MPRPFGIRPCQGNHLYLCPICWTYILFDPKKSACKPLDQNTFPVSGGSATILDTILNRWFFPSDRRRSYRRHHRKFCERRRILWYSKRKTNHFFRTLFPRWRSKQQQGRSLVPFDSLGNSLKSFDRPGRSNCPSNSSWPTKNLGYRIGPDPRARWQQPIFAFSDLVPCYPPRESLPCFAYLFSFLIGRKIPIFSSSILLRLSRSKTMTPWWNRCLDLCGRPISQSIGLSSVQNYISRYAALLEHTRGYSNTNNIHCEDDEGWKSLIFAQRIQIDFLSLKIRIPLLLCVRGSDGCWKIRSGILDFLTFHYSSAAAGVPPNRFNRLRRFTG